MIQSARVMTIDQLDTMAPEVELPEVLCRILLSWKDVKSMPKRTRWAAATGGDCCAAVPRVEMLTLSMRPATMSDAHSHEHDAPGNCHGAGARS